MPETETLTGPDEPDAHDGDHGGHGHGHGHDEIHLPPNSWVPISLAGALTAFFVGFLLNGALGWIPGGVWTAATLVAWFRAARNEYNELPE